MHSGIPMEPMTDMQIGLRLRERPALTLTTLVLTTLVLTTLVLTTLVLATLVLASACLSLNWE